MSELTIAHRAAEGTLLDGTSRGDGAAQILKPRGWRWFPGVGQWGIPRSRDRRANRARIDGTAAALHEAGWTVTTEIDDSPRPFSEAEAERLDHQADRIDHLSDRHDRNTAAAQASSQHAHQLTDAMPLGQPIINDATRRAYRDMHRATDRAVADHHAEQHSADKLAAAEANAAGRYNPATVANRIDRIEAVQRDRRRKLAGYTNQLGDQFPPATGSYADRLQADLTDLEDQATYWRQVRAQQVEAGQATTYSADTIQAGDLVQIHGSSWWQVKRANPKTVTLASRGCQTRAPYHQIRNHCRPSQQ